MVFPKTNSVVARYLAGWRTKYTPRMDKYKPGLILSPPFILPDFTTARCLTYPVPTYGPLRPVMIGTPRL